MHSGLLVFLWLVAVASLQFLGPVALAVVLGTSIAVAAVFAPQRSWRLVRRVRFILLAIVILFAGFTPGELLFVHFPRLSPTHEGVMLAFEHATRVLVVVLLVSLLMEKLPPQRLVGALYALLRPFEVVGFPADRVAIRTLLVLRLVEAEKTPRWDHWLSDDANDLHGAIGIVRERFAPLDYAALVVLIGLLCALVVWSVR